MANEATTKESRPFSVIATGGKQYKVSVGDTIRIEIAPEFEEGKKVTFNDVLLTDDGANKTVVGAPLVSGAVVEGEVLALGRAKKITVVKYKAKSRYHKKRGHRQCFAEVKIAKE
jgi:large subunit ribosomal protein L21